MKSNKFSLNSLDLEKWAKNTLLFSMPALIIVLLSLQNGSDWKVAVGAGYVALLNALLDLTKKWYQGD